MFEHVAESALKACCLVKDAQGRSFCEPLRGWFWSTFCFVSCFFKTEYASLSKYLSKNVQVVIQVVNNKKVMAKTPREANLYGNWCGCKGLKKPFDSTKNEITGFDYRHQVIPRHSKRTLVGTIPTQIVSLFTVQRRKNRELEREKTQHSPVNTHSTALWTRFFPLVQVSALHSLRRQNAFEHLILIFRFLVIQFRCGKRQDTTSSVGRSGIDRSIPDLPTDDGVARRNVLKCLPTIPPDIYYRSNRIYCVVSIVCCVHHVCWK